MVLVYPMDSTFNSLESKGDIMNNDTKKIATNTKTHTSRHNKKNTNTNNTKKKKHHCSTHNGNTKNHDTHDTHYE